MLYAQVARVELRIVMYWRSRSQIGAILFAASVAGWLCGTRPGFADVTRALLSVDGVEVPQGKEIVAFNIETFGVEFLGVCHVPGSWEFKIEKYADPEGVLSGKADNQRDVLRDLRDLFLVDVYEYQPLPRPNHPASFAGWVKIASHPLDPAERRVLHADNFRLTTAARCPDAPPAQLNSSQSCTTVARRL
jgi:hypothetical protein